MIYWMFLLAAAIGAACSGVIAMWWSMSDYCFGLTLLQCFKFVPYFGFALVILSASVIPVKTMTRKDGVEYVGVVTEFVLIHASSISALLIASIAFFPDARLWHLTTECGDTGESYFTNLIGPFLLGSQACWMLMVGLGLWVENHLKTTEL